MGRELRRVPLDFDWPIDKTWDGYLNPHYAECSDCDVGMTTAGRYLSHLTQLILIAGSDSIRGRKHPWITGGLFPNDPPTPDMAELTGGLAGRPPDTMGHDGSDNWAAWKKIVEAAGLDPKTWGICLTCGGSAIDPAIEEAYEAWEPTDPPTGEGYQLWETTSEGSPQSPVFADLDTLCLWAETGATTFGSQRATATEWKRMLDGGLVHHDMGNGIILI